MKYLLLGLGALSLIHAETTYAEKASSLVPQPTTCISSQFSATGNEHWKSLILKLTNNCGNAVDFQNAAITFQNQTAVNTNFWGDFSPLPYPDNALNITSQAQANNFLASLNLHFPTYPGTSTSLPVGKSIQIMYGVSQDNHVEGSTNVYLQGAVSTGALSLQNHSSKPQNVSQNYALVHVMLNGQTVNDVQLGWGNSASLILTPGTYTLSPEQVTDTVGTIYQGNANPASVVVVENQTVSSAISYTQVQQTGKILIHTEALPTPLSGYPNPPAVILTQSGSGAAVSKNVTWNADTTVTDLKEGNTYSLSSEPISYNGTRCTPAFSPANLVASSTPPTSNLTYTCSIIAQESVTINVTGAPASVTSLNVSLTPNDGSAVVSQVIDLNNGTGSETLSLTQGMLYTVSADPVPGYSISFSPQPLSASTNAIETISLTSISSNTPVAANGQLKVCGTKLCNEYGVPIQLKGMSSHGLQWYGEGNCLTQGSLDALSNNFKANVIRLALYVQEGGYETNPQQFTNQINRLIDEATRRGIYVIVDWHILNPGDPNYNLERAKTFFTAVINAHKNNNNLIYEIANEPNGVSWATIKNYAEKIIPVIRALDNKSPILIGTRGWSSLGVSDGSGYQEIVNNPVPFSNIMYTFHFYAASHRDNYLNTLSSAADVLPVFVTEFGTQTFSGDGENDFVMSDKYMQVMASKKISWTNWNYSDDFRSGAIWKTNACSQGTWSDANLKPSGTYIKNKILNP